MKNLFSAILRISFICQVLMTLLPVMGISQEAGSCAEKLRNAQNLFMRGQVEQVAALISGCLRSGLNREEEITAYKLLIQSYLFEDELELADSTMLAFLKKNPEYVISPTDHSDFVHLFKSFKTKKLVQISFHGGTSMPFLNIVEARSFSGLKGKNGYRTNALNLFGLAEVKFQVKDRLELNVEAGYAELSFYNYEDFMGFSRTSYTEYQKRIQTSVSLTYDTRSFGRITPYGRVGLGPSFIFGTSAQTSNEMLDENNPFDRTPRDVEMINTRISYDIMAQAGAGLKYKTREGYFFCELRSNFGIRNQNKSNQQLTGDLPWFFFYSDDLFRLNYVNFSIGYTFIFYKPVKLED